MHEALTPLEFARRAIRTGASTEIHELTELFCRARYGGAALTPAETRHAEALIRSLRTAAVA